MRLNQQNQDVTPVSEGTKMSHLEQPADYIITIEGCIDCALVEWSGPISIASIVTDDDQATTILSGIETDQAGLVGLIRYLHGLGIVLLSVVRVDYNQPLESF
jgi:hypothetical protein